MIFFFGGLGLILGILSGATFGIFNILGDFIYSYYRLFVLAVAITAVANVALNLALIPAFSILGAAIATVATTSVIRPALVMKAVPRTPSQLIAV